MNKQEILNEINRTKQYLTNLEKMLSEYERWKPKPGEDYYCLDSDNSIMYRTFCFSNPFDINRIKTYNYFKAKQEAKAEAEKILVRRMLEDIARRLNSGQKIDWDIEEQKKYFIRFNYWQNGIEFDSSFKQKLQGVIYCLDSNFLNVAIREIGEERLKKYLRGE